MDLKQGKWYVSRIPEYENWMQRENKKIVKQQLLITAIPAAIMVLLLILA